MDSQESDLVVLARIPDLGPHGPGQHAASDATTSHRRPLHGRWIGQMLSYRLLAGLTLCLVTAAVLPNVLSRWRTPGELPLANDALGGRRMTSSNDLGDAKGANGLKDATVVRAGAESPPPQRLGGPQPAADGAPTMSQWPRAKPVEYEADTRDRADPQDPRRDGRTQ
jgi:hypothetical protein